MNTDQSKSSYFLDSSFRRFAMMGAVFGGLGVVLGAFGAHGLADLFAENGREQVWETAAHYHLIHAVMIVISAMLGARWACGLLIGGIAVFSGSLYLLAVLNISWLGAITPLGGLMLIGGWVALLVSIWRR